MFRHLALVLFSALFCVSDAVSAPTALPRGDFISFGQSLHLPATTLQPLAHEYAQAHTYSRVLGVACQTAIAALGPAKVKAGPALRKATANKNWSKTCWAAPRCAIWPSSARDVSLSLNIITYFAAKFAVRGGGHSPNPGWSSVGNQGILIDLWRLNSVAQSRDRTFVSVGSGARWRDVYSALDGSGVVVVGARIPTVGVGGSVLGGGLSYISNRFGLVADNVRNFEVVLANGTVINASAGKNQDLFWALKGGGPNFGIVTRYDLDAVPTPPEVWVQVNVYATTQAPAVLGAFNQWQNDALSAGSKSNVEIQISLDYVAVVLIYSEPASKPPSAFSAFFTATGVQPVDVALPGTNVTYNKLSEIIGSVESPEPARNDYRGCSTRIDANLTQSVYAFWREKALAVRTATGANQTFVLQHVGQNLIEYGSQKGGNALNIPKAAQQWWTTIVRWTDAADDDLVRSVSIATAQQWQALGSDRGLNLPFLYMNDASRDQNPLSSYGTANLARLKHVSRRYDPGHIFQTLQNNGFLLSKA